MALKAKITKAEFEKLVLGDGGLQSLAKILIDIATVGCGQMQGAKS